LTGNIASLGSCLLARTSPVLYLFFGVKGDVKVGSVSLSLSPTFLGDLAQVYATLGPPPLSAAFLSDLAQVHATLPVASDANLRFLANRLDESLRCPVSLFRTMDCGRLETAHTRTLAWLLDPNKNEEHGFGDALLAALLRRLADRDHFDHLQVKRVVSEYPLEGSAGSGRLDVLAEGEWESMGERICWTLVIEAKVDAWEGEAQLDKYDEWLRSHAADRQPYRIFLTPSGRTPDTGSEEWQPLDYLELVQIFRAVYGGLRHAPGFHFLRFYLAGILQDICHLPRNLAEDAADPHAVASYLKTVFKSLAEKSKP